MKKVFKNNIKLIIGIIIGGLLSGGVVYAAVSASAVTYSNTNSGLKDSNGNNVTNVQEAIDVLYSKVKPAYTGTTTFTPTETVQTILTNGKLLNSDITINAIPSTYKYLEESTSVDASKLLSGETAYDNLGNYITGTHTEECVKGSFSWTSEPYQIAPFNPSFFVVYGTSTSRWYHVYDRENDSSNTIGFNDELSQYPAKFSLSTNFTINNGLYTKNTNIDPFTAYYIACR